MNIENIQASMGYDGCDFEIVDEDTIVSLQGAFISLWNTSNHKKDYIQCPRQNGYAQICTSSNNSLIAATEYGLQPECHIYQTPSKRLIAQFPLQTTLRTLAMSFSRDASYLMIIGGVPDFTISIYDLKEQHYIKTPITKLPCKHTQMKQAAFNPRNREQFCILSDSKVYFFTLRPAFTIDQAPGNHEDNSEEAAPVQMNQIFRYEVTEFSTSEVTSIDDSDVVFTSFKWDMWNRIHICTNQMQLLQVSSHDTPALEQALEIPGIPLSTLVTQKHLIVATDDGLITWYCVEPPYENPDGKVDNTLCLKLTNQVAYEYDFQEQIPEESRCPAFFMKYSRSYKTILMGTQNGILAKLPFEAEKLSEEEEEEDQKEKQKKVLDIPLEFLGRFHTAPISGIRELDSSTQFITISEDHTMAIWEATSQQQLALITLTDRPVSLAVSASGRSAFIGTEHGAFLIYDVTNRKHPRLVKQMRLFEDQSAQLDHIVASLNGKILLLASSASDRVFVVSQKADEDFTIYGFIQMKGLVMSVSFAVKDDELWAAAVLSNNLMQVSKIPTEKEQNRLLAVPQERTLTSYRKVDRGTNMILTSSLTTRFFVTGDDKYLKQYDLWPQDSFENIDWRKAPIQPNEEYASHSIGTKCYSFSLVLKKLATGGKDGLIIVRDPNQVRQAKEFQTHAVVGGGVQAVCLSLKLPFVFCAGVDGSIFIISIEDGKTYPRQPMYAPDDHGAIAKMPSQNILNVDDMKLFTDVMQEEFEKGNAEKKEEFKRQMMEKLGVIQQKLKSLLHENNNVTEIERLERDEFVVDVQKQDQFVQEGDNVCTDIRNEADKTNLRLELLRERVIDQTWSRMETQSKAIKSIQGETLLFNFGIRKRTPQETKVLNMLINQRKIELVQKYTRVEKQLREALIMRDFSSMQEGYFMNRTAGKPEFMTDESIALAAAEFAAKDAEKKARRNAEELSKQATTGKGGEEGKRKPYLKLTKGRLGTKVRKADTGDDGGKGQNFAQHDIKGMEETHWKVVYLERELEDIKKALDSPNIYDLLYDSFELYTDQRKRTQIELIREIVFELKRDYNKEFDSLETFKQEQFYAIKEKNEQIKELQENLKHSVDVTLPKEHELERPNLIFEVADDEIKVEKYLTKEEKARLAEVEAKRLAREALLKGDNVGQRGLKAMMGGELVFKKDKNLLEMDLVREDWMAKPDEQMTEDERQKFKDFQQKEKDFKEKQRKAWEFTLKNIKNEIQEIQISFEERILQVYKKRLFFEHRIYEQELYIIRLIIMMHEVSETRANSNKYTDELENIRQQFEERSLFLMNCQDQMAEFQKMIQNDQSEKHQEQKLTEYCAREQLGKKDYYNFLRAGKPQARVQVLPEQRAQMTAHIVDLDPFNTIDNALVKEILKKMEQKEVYDYSRDRPGEIVREQFDEIVRQRQERIKMDKVKEINNKRLANIKDFLKYLEFEVQQIHEKQEILENKDIKTKTRVKKLKYNFEVIIYLKQGQVEVPQLPVATDYKDAILLQQSVVLDENKMIKKRGDEKVQNMIQILKFETSLKQVQYENKRLKLQIVDFEERAKDVQLYRVTKQTQEIIQGKHVKKEEEDKKNLDKQTAQLKQNCDKRMEAIKGMQLKLRREIKEKQQENEQLEAKARQLQMNVDQRQQIEGLKSNTNTSSDNDPRKKAKDVANQRKLLDVIKQQEEEIMFLKDELDRLRARTFPSFAHLQGKQENPDQR